MPKDNFSTQSGAYSRFRPGYPDALFEYLYAHCTSFECAWDCGAGNGQIASQLATKFQQVEATDISENQLKNALQAPNIHYSVQAAEAPEFPDHIFDLIVVGQAAHWFDFGRFYPGVLRVIKPGGLLALVGYNLLKIDPDTDELVNWLYKDVMGQYWDAERRHVDAAYATLPFPFQEIPFPEMNMEYAWTREHFIGYLGTWSALQHFIRQNGYTPLDDKFFEKLKMVWPDNEVKTVLFPIFARVARPSA